MNKFDRATSDVWYSINFMQLKQVLFPDCMTCMNVWMNAWNASKQGVSPNVGQTVITATKVWVDSRVHQVYA